MKTEEMIDWITQFKSYKNTIFFILEVWNLCTEQ